ncbi:MAG TPA: DUF134 domain-containing protein [Euryarchaeota archaeon]|nr:DUF134 domain-containing protein [Euryarchaeota archaeon]
MPHGRRGRQRGRRWIDQLPATDCYMPRTDVGGPTGIVNINLEELEAIRLVDLIDMTQEEAAFSMGISRKTLWRDLVSARKKVAQALVNGWRIEIAGGDYALRQ